QKKEVFTLDINRFYKIRRVLKQYVFHLKAKTKILNLLVPLPLKNSNIMNLQRILTTKIQEAVQSLFDTTIERVEFQATRRDFEGDITFVIFPLVKVIKGNPVEIGNKIGEYLVANTTEVVRFNVVSGFLNIVISDEYYLDFFNKIKNDEKFGFVAQGENAAMVEYASPNTNKPLHL